MVYLLICVAACHMYGVFTAWGLAACYRYDFILCGGLTACRM